MIVVDTNVIAYLLIPGDASHLAEKVYEKDPEWVSPRLWRSEFRSVLAQYLRRGLGLEDALQLMDAADDILRHNEYEVTSRDVLRLVASSSCSSYDCEYVALARDLGVPLVTRDERLRRAFPSESVSMESFVQR